MPQMAPWLWTLWVPILGIGFLMFFSSSYFLWSNSSSVSSSSVGVIRGSLGGKVCSILTLLND